MWRKKDKRGACWEQRGCRKRVKTAKALMQKQEAAKTDCQRVKPLKQDRKQATPAQEKSSKPGRRAWREESRKAD